jgi:hypothetical protein
MNTDITRGPKICPSCGKENPPTAVHCFLCLTPLEGAIQTAPAPPWDEVRLPSFPDDEPRSRLPLKGCAAVWTMPCVVALSVLSAIVTFCVVCSAVGFGEVMQPAGPNHLSSSEVLFWAIGLGSLAATAALVATLIIVVFLRRQRR